MMIIRVNGLYLVLLSLLLSINNRPTLHDRLLCHSPSSLHFLLWVHCYHWIANRPWNPFRSPCSWRLTQLWSSVDCWSEFVQRQGKGRRLVFKQIRKYYLIFLKTGIPGSSLHPRTRKIACWSVCGVGTGVPSDLPKKMNRENGIQEIKWPEIEIGSNRTFKRCWGVREQEELLWNQEEWELGTMAGNGGKESRRQD